MKKNTSLFKGIIFALLGTLTSFQVFGYGVGTSLFPLSEQKPRSVSAEFLGIVQSGTGAGVQTRFVNRFNDYVTGDAGIGISGGDRPNRFFAGADVELFPDYDRQPRISLKAVYMNAEEFDIRRNIFGIAPTISKGLNLWGQEAYPYMAFPLNLSLDSGKEKYEFQSLATLGIAAPLPISGFEKYVAGVEANIKIKDSYSGILFSISAPLQ